MKSNQITKDTVVADILSKYPEKSRELALTMMQLGLHCVGCGASAMETIEQGTMGHGWSKDQMNSLLDKLNSIIVTKSS